MDVTAWDVYLIGNIGSFVPLLLLAGLAVGALGVFLTAVAADTESLIIGAAGLSVILLGLLLLTGAAAIPNSKTLAAMYFVPPIVNNEDVRAIGDEVPAVARRLLWQWVDQHVPLEKVTPEDNDAGK